MKERCILIGGAGFLGLNIAGGLSRAGYEVVVVDRRSPDLSSFPKDISFLQADYRDSPKLTGIFRSGDFLLHLACTSLPGTPYDKMDDDVKENVFESINLFKLAIKKGVKKIIFPSSGGTVYGESESFPIKEDAATNPICSYGITKLMIEKFMLFLSRIYGIDYLIFRISNPYGQGQSTTGEQGLIVNMIFKLLNDSQITIFGDEQIVRDYIFIDDVVNAFILGIGGKIPNGIYNIGTGKGHSIKKIIELVSMAVGREPEIAYSERRLFDVQKNILDSGKIYAASGWKAEVPVEEGIRHTCEWLRGFLHKCEKDG
ncbi:NAD-dependent epimerase/dehydratase family protein [Candidatus Omnitrophota bacterium]